MKRLSFAIASLFFVCGMARADEPPVTDWTMEVVVVDAQSEGPAMWRLKKGDSEIVILGTVGPMPENTAWNSTHLAEAIDGAGQVLLPPQASAGIFDLLGMSWFLFTHRDALSMPDDQKLEESLSPELRARFVRAREAIGNDAERYEDDSPLVAGFKLLMDYLKTAKLTRDLPADMAKKIARAKHVKVRRIADYSAVPIIKEMLNLPPAAGQTCFETALGDYETLSRHAAAAAEAWAVGNLAGIKAHYSVSLFNNCVAQAKRFGEIDRRAVDDTLKAIRAALAKPGRTVLLMDIGWLFRAGGVAEKLAAEGLVLESLGK